MYFKILWVIFFSFSFGNNCVSCVLFSLSVWLDGDRSGGVWPSPRQWTTTEDNITISLWWLQLHFHSSWIVILFLIKQRKEWRAALLPLLVSQPVRPEPFQLRHFFIDEVEELREGSLDSWWSSKHAEPYSVTAASFTPNKICSEEIWYLFHEQRWNVAMDIHSSSSGQHLTTGKKNITSPSKLKTYRIAWGVF